MLFTVLEYYGSPNFIVVPGKRKKRNLSKRRRITSSTPDLRNSTRRAKTTTDPVSTNPGAPLSHSASFGRLTQGRNVNRMTVEVLDTDSEASSHRSDDEAHDYGHEADPKDQSRFQV